MSKLSSTRYNSMNKGFTLIELVIVVVILGLLAVAAVPRFLDATDDAEDSSLAGVAGNFSTAVGLVKSQWILDGGKSDSVTLDGSVINVDDETGYPVGDTNAGDNSNEDCVLIFQDILSAAPTISETYNTNVNYVARMKDADLCVYFLADTVESTPSVAGDIGSLVGKYFTYDRTDGSVAVFDNN